MHVQTRGNPDCGLYRGLYNNPSYSRILIGFRLWSQDRRTTDVIITKFSPLCIKMAECFEN